MTSPKSFNVAIIGGGIAGLTLAIALHHRHIPITVYEQAQQFGEIGAGVSSSPNAVQAMKSCHDGIYDAFETVCTRNLWPLKQKVWFDYLNGYGYNTTTTTTTTTTDEDDARNPGPAFSISNDLGQNAVHRAHFLEGAGQVIFPTSEARFGKRLEDITENNSNGSLVLSFAGGTTTEADIVVGCDGIKSRVRQIIVGRDHPFAHPAYTHKYAYRGLTSIDDAIKAVGEERAQNACMHMGPGGHVLTFPVNQGKTLNIVVFRISDEDWPDSQKLMRPASREDALRDFVGYGSNVVELLKLTKPDLDIWAIFDLRDHPVPTFNKGQICISGDAAHATSPHHGAGAGFCIEDSAILAEFLFDERVQTHTDLEAVLAALFDGSRRERSQWLVQSSRWIGDCYEWRAEGVGNDFRKIEAEINRRNGMIANLDIKKMCDQARRDFLRAK